MIDLVGVFKKACAPVGNLFANPTSDKIYYVNQRKNIGKSGESSLKLGYPPKKFAQILFWGEPFKFEVKIIKRDITIKNNKETPILNAFNELRRKYGKYYKDIGDSIEDVTEYVSRIRRGEDINNKKDREEANETS